MLNVAEAEAPQGNEPAVFYPADLEEYKRLAYVLIKEKWGAEQWEYFDDLVNRESGWNNLAQNSNSTAYGSMQFLNSTWGLVGCTKTTSLDIQIECGVKYIEKNYDTPKNAIIFHNINNYY